MTNRPFQMRAWSCITSYPLRGLPYLVYDKVNPAMVNSMMLRSSMLAFEKVYVRMCTIAQVQMKIWDPANSDSGYTSLFANAIYGKPFFLISFPQDSVVYFQFLLVENCPYNH